MEYLFASVCVACAAYLLGMESAYWGWFLFMAFLAVVF